MKVKIMEEDFIFEEFFKVKKSLLTHELYDGTMSGPLIRYSVEKQDGVGVLVVNRALKEIVLIEQYRFPMSDWIIEVVAGGLEKGESVETAARRETLEETGYTLDKLELIEIFYVSPGLISEKVYLFIGDINADVEQQDISEIKDQGEDISLIKIPFSDIISWISSKKIVDAKTLIALYAFVLNEDLK